MNVGKIVVGVDGSEDARRALAWAASEAVLRGAELHVVHAWMIPDVGPRTDAAPFVDEARAHAARLLDTTVADVRAQHGERLRLEVHLEKGSAVEHLLAHAAAADLLVVGSRGRGGFSSLLLGSVSQQLAHLCRCPVVIVHKPMP